ncbi:MAG: hypothetical protein J0L84_20410 [Verrucomicrobia bacterium]|nr:hypothetical protein [Verrucomicrobiota bacterium]
MNAPSKPIWLVAAVAFLGTIILLGILVVPVLLIAPPRYDAECVVRLAPAQVGSKAPSDPVADRDLAKEQERMMDPPAVQTLIENLKLDRYYQEKLRSLNPLPKDALFVLVSRQLEVSRGAEPGTLRIHASESDARMAAAMANELAAIHRQALENGVGSLRSSPIKPAEVPTRAGRTQATMAAVVIVLIAAGAASIAGWIVAMRQKHR